MPRTKQFDEEEILKKAMMLFWKKGFYDTSIKDLIDFLGISNASIYNTFKGGKEELFKRAFQLYRDSNLQGFKAFLESQADVRQGLRMAFAKIIHDDHVDEDCKACFVVNTSIELIPINNELHNSINQYKEVIVGLFYNFLQKGVQSGQISEQKDLDTLANLYYTFMMGLRVDGKTQPDPKESMGKVELMLSLLD
ncbi:MAG: TetR/AcrR family transcriptional regulator [Bacteroidota bacterium]